MAVIREITGQSAMETVDKIQIQLYFAQLIGGYLNGNLSEEQVLELQRWIADSEGNRLLFEKMCSEPGLERAQELMSRFDAEAALQRVKSTQRFAHGTPLRRRLWTRMAIAASLAVAVFSAGLYFYNKDNVNEGSEMVSYSRDILPGKKGASLTLASGKRILLSEMQTGTLASEAGVRIVKDQDGQLTYQVIGTTADRNKIHTLTTSNGETQRIRLQDGSIAYLNAASSLSYPASFQGMGSRKVELKGEGYFEIAKDAKHPFIVNARGQSVEVLGTHFNINAYDNEPVVKTALFEGSVRLSSAAGEKILVPGQEAVLKNSSLRIEVADEEETLSWKNDRFVFNDESLESIMRKVERWYDVEVVYNGVDKNDAFGGSMTRNENISAVLKALAMTEGVKFRIEGRKVYVLPVKKR